MVRNRISPAEAPGRHRRCGNRAIFVGNPFDVGSVDDVRDFGYIANICDIHNAQILNIVVIPGNHATTSTLPKENPTLPRNATSAGV
jgi:hypothetical protein